jgi:hypothetical protein
LIHEAFGRAERTAAMNAPQTDYFPSGILPA